MLLSFRRQTPYILPGLLILAATCHLGLAQQPGKCKIGDLGRYCEDIYEDLCRWTVGKAQECWPTRDTCHATCSNTGVCACDYGFSPKDSCISAPGTPITRCTTHYKCKRDTRTQNIGAAVQNTMKLAGNCLLKKDQENCASLPYCAWKVDETPSLSQDETPPPSLNDDGLASPSFSPSAAVLPVVSLAGETSNSSSSTTTSSTTNRTTSNATSSTSSTKSSSVNNGSSSSSSSRSKCTRGLPFVLFCGLSLLLCTALFL
mmetsp:Transcript_11376/g.23995  ORF Transcript_11376/g.23995 Transcript_11376/m.23995 type:complete len:260 (+) Transcript_11376:201-980(+)